MLTFQGKSVTDKTAPGKIFLYKKEVRQISAEQISDVKAELARYEKAVGAAVAELQALYTEAEQAVGKKDAAVFQMHQMLLEDEGFGAAVKTKIEKEKVSTEYAILETADSFGRKFSEMQDDYIRERGADVKDVAECLLAALCGEEKQEGPAEPSIIVAEDLTPSEAVRLPRELVTGVVTKQGSLHSHTAILLKTMNIPALVAVPLSITEALNGKPAAIDGESGTFYIEPEEEEQALILKKQKEQQEKQEMLQAFKEKECRTADGRRILLCANIGGSEDLDEAIHNGADGVGLFEVNFCIWKGKTIPPRKNSFRSTAQQRKKCPAKKSLSARWTLAQTKAKPISDWKKKKIPPWDFAPSAFA